MLECWQDEPRKRPTFTQLRAKFDAMLLAERKDAYIDLQIDTNKPYYKMEGSRDFLHEPEKSPSHKSSSLQGSPHLSRASSSRWTPVRSPSFREMSPRPSSRPVSLLMLRSEQMNQYVDEPAKLGAMLTVPKTAVGLRRASAGNLQPSEEGEGPGILITITPEPN